MRALRLLLVVMCATAMCGCTMQQSSAPTSASGVNTAASPSRGGAASSASGPSASGPAASGPSPSGSSSPVENYLALAHGALPRLTRSALVAQGRTICSTVQHGSRHDAVGDLAGQIGDEAEANRLVTAAVAAYCPDLAGTR